MKTIILASLALATLAASPALAASHKRMLHPATTAQNAYASAGYAWQGSNTVVVDGQIVGRDPDPFIRLQLLRDHGLEAN